MRKYKIVVCSAGNTTEKFIKKIQSDPSFDIVGLIPDASMDKGYIADFKEKFTNIASISLDDLSEIDFDIIFTLEYRKLIRAEYVDKYFFLNLHGGILPKYRGFSSNAWAIINGEDEIGYTLHRMDSMMDSGDIYFIKTFPIRNDQTYSMVHDHMVDSIISDVPDVIKQIIDGEIRPVKQKGNVIYGMKFDTKMGIINDFNVNSSYIVNLWRCMAKPLGSGIHFRKNDDLFDVGYVLHGCKRNTADYIAVPGRIVNMTANELWIKTRDNIVIFGDITYRDGIPVNIKQMFMIGNSLQMI